MLSQIDGLALKDLTHTLRNMRLCLHMSWGEIRRRYRRTALGPFWATIGVAIFTTTIGLLYSFLWKVDVKQFLPYLSAGLMIWNMFSLIVNEGCMVFVQANHVLKDIPIPYTTFVFDNVLRNVINFFHGLIVYLVILWWFPVEVNLNTLLFIPGLLLFILNAAWIVLLLGMFCARFRDMQPLVTNLMQVAFFVTPIVWPLEQILASKKVSLLLIYLNPLFNLLEVVRAPLLGKCPSLYTWAFAISFTVLGWYVAMTFFSRFRKRIIYWL